MFSKERGKNQNFRADTIYLICRYSEVSIKRADLLREQGRTFLAKS